MKKIFAVLLAVIMNTSLAYAAGSVIEYVPMNNIAFSCLTSFLLASNCA